MLSRTQVERGFEGSFEVVWRVVAEGGVASLGLVIGAVVLAVVRKRFVHRYLPGWFGRRLPSTTPHI